MDAVERDTIRRNASFELFLRIASMMSVMIRGLDSPKDTIVASPLIGYVFRAWTIICIPRLTLGSVVHLEKFGIRDRSAQNCMGSTSGLGKDGIRNSNVSEW